MTSTRRKRSVGAPGLLGLMGAVSVTAGCPEISRFSTGAGESYCGQVTGASFVRAAIPEKARMRLTLDTDELQGSPGTLWSDELIPGTGERFAGTRLTTIPELRGDVLSTLTFGEGRVRNAIAVADLGAVPVVVVLSLLQSGDVEVRLLRGALGSATSSPPAAAARPALFGVFRLKRQAGDCGLR